MTEKISRKATKTAKEDEVNRSFLANFIDASFRYETVPKPFVFSVSPCLCGKKAAKDFTLYICAIYMRPKRRIFGTLSGVAVRPLDWGYTGDKNSLKIKFDSGTQNTV